MILDTPGVNSAEYQKHGECTNAAIKAGAYDALVFLINYEHIGTDDEIAHLLFIKQNVDRSTPIVFCVNKVDSKKRDDSSLEEKMRDIKTYLQEQGFPDATVFLVSSRAAFLYRMRNKLNNEDDIEDLELLSKKVKRSTNLVTLYGSIKPSYVGNSVDSFEYQCGIGYIEDYIIKLMLEKERND
jgi:GTPase Era involved in 16S rRNA processing